MPTNRNIVEMVEKIRKGSGEKPWWVPVGCVDGVYMAEVESVEPLTIRLHDLSIDKNLYINPALMLEASDDNEAIKEPFKKVSGTTEVWVFLEEFHKRFVLKKGDMVTVCVSGSFFYIAGKAVKV